MPLSISRSPVQPATRPRIGAPSVGVFSLPTPYCGPRRRISAIRRLVCHSSLARRSGCSSPGSQARVGAGRRVEIVRREQSAGISVAQLHIFSFPKQPIKSTEKIKGSSAQIGAPLQLQFRIRSMRPSPGRASRPPPWRAQTATSAARRACARALPNAVDRSGASRAACSSSAPLRRSRIQAIAPEQQKKRGPRSAIRPPARAGFTANPAEQCQRCALELFDDPVSVDTATANTPARAKQQKP